MFGDERLMSICLEEAWKYQTLTLPNPAVGAMVVEKNTEVLSVCAHTKSGTAHAEVNALKVAYEKLSNQVCPAKTSNDIHYFLAKNHRGIFKDCSLYVTLEPCNHYGKTPPCAELLEIIRPKRVIVGAMERQAEAFGGAKRLLNAGIEVRLGILEKECNAMLYPFLCQKENGRFNLFKIAQRLNGDYKSGIISGLSSREFTHNQRSVANALIVSGATLREDRPTLDSRYALKDYGKKAPNVRILTSQSEFDLDIPLFSVPDREVKICHSISDLGLESGFNIIEGGWRLFKSLNSQIDMVLVHFSPTLKMGVHSAGFEWGGELLYTQKLENDALLWIKRC
ncbi:riboflavin biosynthesis protein RibD [Helicobacter sp. 12S02232-10]|uniref:bifunctional diaminohydroxyphosphoribosylaminopyrimidine deaminase/5-amino-6-(5-phosphoribosylamino)uracil reductase RibD n=1 Tax=Helicobacter sp. 12S02232-10 TaxID=1476197 RepID=UPI000BA4F4E2|nr:bifunctional diaminohydroxyphosphoribosylaminopyrimidine deaminase/5-amino-6-(5-phosphoribosylamino)uracil reductase RibD [Helicobacter sp. 12S02232-10]PAF49533.1 riboflavin biosynthesis protein RibD [Helicobacter sp. 12S02232-10]